MKFVIIVLACAVVGGVAGFIATATIMQSRQNATNPAPVPTGDADRDMTNATKFFNQSSGDLSARQEAAMIGGGVGVGVGLAIGIGATMFFAKRGTRLTKA